jgi:hypothetical protein
LAAVDWDETTVLAGVLLVYRIWVLAVDNITLVNCLASIPAREWIVLVSEFNLGVTTD